MRGRFDAVIQAPIVKHPSLAEFNPSSVNSVRFTTYRKLDGEIVVLSQLLRMGRAGSLVDNAGSGGVFVGLDTEGRFDEVGYFKALGRASSHPDSGAVFSGRSVPAFAALRDAPCRRARAHSLDQFCILGRHH